MADIFRVEEALTQRINKKDVLHMQRKAASQQKAVTYSASQYMHGPNGLMNLAGVDPDVFSTVYRPRGISTYIPTRMSRFVNPIYRTLTAQATDSGSEPATVCDKGPVPGDSSEANLTAPFGLVKRSTKTVTMDRVGEITNRAEPFDLNLVNAPNSRMSSWVPEVARALDLNDEKRFKFWQVGLSIERLMERQAFTGAGAGQGVSGAGYKEFYGLETLVNTGKVDAVTNAAVPALDPLLINWNATISASQAVYGVTSDLPTLFARVFKFLDQKAEALQLAPVQFAIVMQQDAFWELTAIWPCSYLTNGCTLSGNNTQYVMGSEQVAMRDEMRNGSFLWVNGQKRLVITTDAITEANAAGGQKSDIYVLPLSVQGRAALYWEAFDFANPLEASIMAELPPNEFSITDGGKYIWTYDRSSFCVYYEAMVRARLVLRAPFITARIQNVAYPSVLHSFNAYPSSVYYQPVGGATTGSIYGGLNFPTAV